MPTLFSYGTLRDPRVQLQVFCREIAAPEDALAGFVVGSIRIGGGDFLILRPGGPDDLVRGVALAVSEDDLAQADAYETADYVRIGVTLASGRPAQVYVARAPNTRVV
jgi:hypothetical protein